MGMWWPERAAKRIGVRGLSGEAVEVEGVRWYDQAPGIGVREGSEKVVWRREWDDRARQIRSTGWRWMRI